MKYLLSFSLALTAFTGLSVDAQTIVNVNKTEILVDTSTGPKLEKGKKVQFLNNDLKVVGQGEVSKVSSSGQKAMVHLTNGTASVGMSLELVDHHPDSSASSEMSSSPAPAPSIHRPEPPLSEQDRRILDRGEISTTRYVIGGIVGTYPLGLGIGHAIQGRYLESGWIFTVGELGSFAVLLTGLGQCLGDYYTYTNCNTGLVTLGFAGLIAFKVWEIIDLWAVPPEQNRRYHELMQRNSQVKFSPTLLPIANFRTGQTEGAMLGLKMSF